MIHSYFTRQQQYNTGKFIHHFVIVFIYFELLLSVLPVHAQQSYVFEKLGEPLHAPIAAVSMVTKASRPMAWVSVESPDLYDVVGIDIDGGKTELTNCS